MFQTLTNIQSEESVGLQQYIDNRDGDLKVGLRSITYTVGWYNVHDKESFSWRSSKNSTNNNTTEIPPGLYSFTQLKNVIEARKILVIDVNKVNGLITLVVTDGIEVLLTDGLLSLLGLDDGLGGQWLKAGSYIGDRAVNFADTKILYLYLEQINTTSNIVDGAPSTILTMIGLGCHPFGDIGTLRVEHPEFKQLQHGTITELKITTRDDSGKILDNHSLPISLTLEIS